MESDLVAVLDPNATIESMDMEPEISIGEIIDEIINTSISQERDETADQTITRLLNQVKLTLFVFLPPQLAAPQAALLFATDARSI